MLKIDKHELPEYPGFVTKFVQELEKQSWAKLGQAQVQICQLGRRGGGARPANLNAVNAKYII